MKGEYEKRLRSALDEQKSDFEKDMEQTALLAKVTYISSVMLIGLLWRKSCHSKKSLNVCEKCHEKRGFYGRLKNILITALP